MTPQRYAVSVRSEVYARLAAVGSPTRMLDAALRDWTPTPEDAARARGTDGRVSVWVDVDLHERIRAAAVARGTTMSDVVEQALAPRIDTESMSLKRLAWACGCTPKGSDEERELMDALIKRVRAL